MSEKTYTITVSESELAALQNALDLYSRMQMGQVFSVVDHVDRIDMSLAGRLEFEDALRPVQRLITGMGPGMSHYPTERSRERGEEVRDLYEHIRYVRTTETFPGQFKPLRYDATKVKEIP